MGLPYSRQINAAFEQVTPLVAAGFKVLRTTRDISIILAAIQVLTVVLLAGIFMALLGVMYCVNPDLENERKAIITPSLRSLAQVSLYGIIKFFISTAIVLGIILALVWKFFMVKRWVADLEYEGNVDANKALEDMDVEISEDEVDDETSKAEEIEQKETEKAKEKEEKKDAKGKK